MLLSRAAHSRPHTPLFPISRRLSLTDCQHLFQRVHESISSSPELNKKKISHPVADVVVPSNPASLLAPANTQHLTLQDVMRLPCWLPPLFVLSRKQEIHSRAESRAAEPPSPAARRNTTSHACPFNLQAAHGVAISPHLPFRNSNVGYFPL